jgi:hypothetical protein
MSWRSSYALPTVPNGLIGYQVSAKYLSPASINIDGTANPIYQFPPLATGLYIVEGYVQLDLTFNSNTNVINNMSVDVGGNETVLVAVPTFIPDGYPQTSSKFYYTNTLVITDANPSPVVTLYINASGTGVQPASGTCIATKLA